MLLLHILQMLKALPVQRDEGNLTQDDHHTEKKKIAPKGGNTKDS